LINREGTPPSFSSPSTTSGYISDGLLDASYRLRALGWGVGAAGPEAEVVIEIEKHSDGTLLVLPARTS